MMNSVPTSTALTSSRDRKRARAQAKRSYTKDWRKEREGAAKPEARVVDRTILGAIGRTMLKQDGHLVVPVEDALELAIATMVAQGYRRREVVGMVRRRMAWLQGRHALVCTQAGLKVPDCPVSLTHAVPHHVSTA